MPDQAHFFRSRIRLSQIAIIVWISPVLFLAPAPACAGTDNVADAGSIQGEVRITRDLPAQRMRFRLYPGFKSIPPPTAKEKRDDEWQNIVIYLKSTSALPELDGESENLPMVQLGETFIPHVLPIVKGSTVKFPNQDPIFHNVFSLSGTKSFDLGRYPKGDSRSVVFEEAGIVPVFCHIHSDMSAIILVLENPYFAIPGPEGHYRIENIPAGSHTLVAWHERSEPVELPVEVVAGEVLELDITVPIKDDDSP
ncbi:hypothetical protein ACFL00_01260 [Pseudomonadota bacterium]